MERQGTLFQPSTVPCSPSSLSHLVSTHSFSWTGGIPSHHNSWTHSFPKYPVKNLCFLIMVSLFSIVFDAMNTAFCETLLCLSELAKLKILHAVLTQDTCDPFCFIQQQTLCVAHTSTTSLST